MKEEGEIEVMGHKVRLNYAHPYHWAPFILIGEWR
jgi:CHAT domain-containing protein